MSTWPVKTYATYSIRFFPANCAPQIRFRIFGTLLICVSKYVHMFVIPMRNWLAQVTSKIAVRINEEALLLLLLCGV